jgi:hypothetical protein
MAWAVSRPEVRETIRGSQAFRTLNHPALRRIDSWLYNRRGSLPGREELGDGGPAAEAWLQDPMGLGQDRTGNVFLSDRGLGGPGRVIWKVAPDGRATIIAGTGRRGIAGSGIPALAADLGSPQSLALDSAGRVYFADSYNHAVFRIERDGMLTRVAGNGRPGDGGDGGPARQAGLNQPYDVSLDRFGNLYIADFGNHRVRKVTRDGRIQTIAGTGAGGYSGDGGPASLARLNGPYGVSAGWQGGILIGDSFNNVVRRVDDRGVIHTIAGTGRRGHSGDGGPAREAELDAPQGIYADREDVIYIGDEHNHAIRVITPDGIIRNLVGTGSPGFAPDGTPVGNAALNDPENLIVRPDRTILFTEAGNRRVRLVGSDSLLRTFAGRGHLP